MVKCDSKYMHGVDIGGRGGRGREGWGLKDPPEFQTLLYIY